MIAGGDLADEGIWFTTSGGMYHRIGKQVPSDMNLGAFLEWFHHPNTTLDQQKEFMKIPMTTHVSAELPSCVTSPPVDVHLRLHMKDGDNVEMISRKCTAAQFPRCLNCAGGYKFQWCGKWTCEGVIARAMSGPMDPLKMRELWAACRQNPQSACRACAYLRQRIFVLL